jgi:hypothetical protein
MFFGKSPQAGNPPPVLHLNGYGDYVFKNVPVVVTNFTTELTNTVDYISTSDTVTQIDEASEASYNPNSNLPVTWAPTMSIFTIQLQPIYSRAAMKDFNLQKFINGDRTDSKGFEFI